MKFRRTPIRIKNSVSAEEVKNSAAMSKLKCFLEGVGKTGSRTGKALKGLRDGIKIGQDLAEFYNSIAQWCGLPQVPKPFLKKEKGRSQTESYRI